MRYEYKIKVFTQDGSELKNRGFDKAWYPALFTAKKTAEAFAERLSNTGISIEGIYRFAK